MWEDVLLAALPEACGITLPLLGNRPARQLPSNLFALLRASSPLLGMRDGPELQNPDPGCELPRVRGCLDLGFPWVLWWVVLAWKALWIGAGGLAVFSLGALGVGAAALLSPGDTQLSGGNSLSLSCSSWDESSSISSGLSDASDNLSSEEFNASSSLNSLPSSPTASRRNSAIAVRADCRGEGPVQRW